ncbi:hypothetical protein [Methylomonas albis]|nr:hypothetical protein [Methylomonas albis]
MRQAVIGIQTAFGSRIERILAKAGGLLVVVESWREGDEEAAEDLSSDGLKVAVIDRRTWRSLQRLGGASPLAEARQIFESAADPAPVNPLHETAAQKLRSAQVLLEQQCMAGVMDLLASALLDKVAALAGMDRAPPANEAAVWLYGDIVPRGLLAAEQITLILQAVSLSQSPVLPEPLMRQVAGDAERFVSMPANRPFNDYTICRVKTKFRAQKAVSMAMFVGRGV